MRKSQEILFNLHKQLEVIKGAFPEQDSPIREDINSILDTLVTYEKALKEEN